MIGSTRSAGLGVGRVGAAARWIVRRPLGSALFLGLGHAALFTLAFPPFSSGIAALLSLAPLAMLIVATPRAFRAGLVVGAASILAWGFHHRWLVSVTPPGLAALLVYLALYPAAFVWIGSWVVRRVGRGRRLLAASVAAPFVWTGLETVRALVIFDGYPWYLLASSTIEWAPWRFLASWIGLLSLTLPLAATGCWLGLAAVTRSRRERVDLVIRAVGLIALCFGLGHLAAPSEVETEALRVAVVQTNVPQSNKTAWEFEQRVDDLDRFIALTEEAAGSDVGGARADVIVWPETMFPGLSLNAEAIEIERANQLRYRTEAGAIASTVFADRLLKAQRRVGVPMVVGAIARIGLRFEEDERGGLRIEADEVYNSAFLVKGGVVDASRYDKMQLTPFGEYMPYISWSDWLESRLLALGAPGMAFDLSAGESAAPLVVETGAGEVRLATPVCFEATMPRVMRRLATGDHGGRRADAIVHLTNDGWFTRWTGGREHHLLLARWRAVELSMPVVRAANTGVSAAIDADGRILSRGPDGREGDAHVDGVMRVDLPIGEDRGATVYARLGDWAAWTCVVASAALMALAGVMGRGRGTKGAEAS